MFPLQEMREWAHGRGTAHPASWPRGGDAGPHEPDLFLRQHINFRGPISSPFQLALLEQEREEVGLRTGIRRQDGLQPRLFEAPPTNLGRQRTAGGGIPTDVFIYGRGEPHRREVTKIGGLPYWPAGRPWPHTAQGELMTFVFQFCFADSRDITGDLPGDVLLFFSEDILVSEEDAGHFTFEWLKLGETDLVEARDIPQTPWRFAPVYSAIYRTFDYPGFYHDQEGGSSWLGAVNGTKIGGQGYWIQENLDDYSPFLCMCATVEPAVHVPFLYIYADGHPWDVGAVDGRSD